MTPRAETKSKKRIIVALDVESAGAARDIVAELRGEAAAFKIGLQLFTATGPDFVLELAVDHRVFLDLKFYDIPNTVGRASVEVARLGVWMFNVHASGGAEMMSRAVEQVDAVCARENIQRPLIIGVTVLTSSDANTLRQIGIEREVEDQVLRLARLTAECGLDGVVASPLEIESIRAAVHRPDFSIVTPGIRPDFGTNDDQRRVTTPRGAVSAGADYLVIGRPILEAKDRLSALRKICEDIDAAVNE